MTKGDGEKIAIRFTEPLVGDVSGNEAYFDVSFQEYSYVPSGSLITVHREVIRVSGYNAVDTSPTLESGVLTDAVLMKKGIELAEKEEEPDGELS